MAGLSICRKGTHLRFLFLDFGARADVVVGIVGMVVVDPKLVVVPVDVRNVAIVIARTRFLANPVKNHQQSFAKLPELSHGVGVV